MGSGRIFQSPNPPIPGNRAAELIINELFPPIIARDVREELR